MREDILAVAERPRSLDAMVGLESLARSLRAYGSKPRAWMFVGPTGVGKTTLARILAVSLQCEHAPFGNPCTACLERRDAGQFQIDEVNASKFRGVEDIEKLVNTSAYMPRPPTQRRVIILDEAQRMSAPAQNLLLKPFEDGPRSTAWIVCTTDPQKILPALRARPALFKVPSLRAEGVRELVKRTCKSVGCKKGRKKLAECLLTAGVFSPRLVVQAVEQMVASGDPEQAASQFGSDRQSSETLQICRATLEADWVRLKPLLKALNPEESDNAIRALMGYLRSVLLGQSSGNTTRSAAEGVQILAKVLFLPEQEKHAVFPGIVYDLCRRFSGTSRR